MDLGQVEKIMQLMRSYGVYQVEVQDGTDKIKVTQGPPATAALPMYSASPAVSAEGPGPTHAPAQSKAKRSNQFEVRSPFVGTFYSAPSPGAEDFVQVGKKVKKGDTLCVVEAMKLMNEIEAERDGVIAEILVKNEEPVEYDQVLFLIE